MNNGLQFESKKSHADGKSSDYVSYPSAVQLFPNSTALGADLLRKLPSYAAQVASANGNVTKASDIYRFFKIQWDLIFKDGIPVAEILLSPYGNVYSSEYWGSVPFSRGSIHLSSADPTAAAIIDPKYFMLDFDFEAQVQAARFIREVFNTEPLGDMAGAETTPGLSTVPADADDEAWADFIKGKCKCIPRFAERRLEGIPLLTFHLTRPVKLSPDYHSCHAAQGDWWCCRHIAEGLRNIKRSGCGCIHYAFPGLWSPPEHRVCGG
jgi:hypothetical protein